MKLSNPTFIYPRVMKIIGLVLLLFSATGLTYQYLHGQTLDTKTTSRLISLGLFFIYFSREKIEDERIHQLKFRALAAGFVAAYMIMFSLSVAYALKVEEFIAVVLMISTAAFYFAKFRE
jgi:hypothetical protein